MSTPEQCVTCRYAKRNTGEKGAAPAIGEMVCSIRLVQFCERQDGMQLLRMVPGSCCFLNESNDCEQYKPARLQWLRKIFPMVL